MKNEMPSQKHNTINNKYYLLLLDVFLKIKKGERVVARHICSTHRVSHSIFMAMESCGLVQGIGATIKRNYRWIAGEPSMQMATKLAGEAKKFNSMSRKKIDMEKKNTTDMKPNGIPREIEEKLNRIEYMLTRILADLGVTA